MLANAGLAVVSALGIAFTAYMLIRSWGGAYWLYSTAVAVVMCGLALVRGRRRAWPPVAGLAVAAGAVGTSLAADLPREPSPVTALALAVLVGSSVRSLPVPSAVAVAAGGAAVTALGWSAGPTAPITLAALLVAGGLVAGVLLRAADLVRRPRW
ncbi:hypothetical protein [Actinomadura sp. WMMA1423]|uniref:hypothetical protein n=1 Tax=Actinomadura sp. WMMA1423 TaxID=2591108 RepID=UPI00197AE9D5|nr:hypothetical protein [Actinomadura sp. WMMA1423]